MQRYPDAPLLTREDREWFHRHYLDSDTDPCDPALSPLLGDLRGLPPALILTAEYDPPVDQGRIYSEALQAYGNRVIYREYPRQIHGFLSLAGLSSAAGPAFEAIGHFLRHEAASPAIPAPHSADASRRPVDA
jgi:acetyl esterase